MELKGVYTALVTPFKDYNMDEESFLRLLDMQLKAGIDGLVPCGSTGEAATLDYDEHERVIELTVKYVKGKIPVMAGTGSNSTKEAIELTESAKKIGADMCLLTTPYYNKPTQEGLYRHYKKIAEEVDIPLVLYNIPGRTGINMSPETIYRLSQIPNIIGIKEASGSLTQVSDIYRLTKGKFVIMSGDDNLFLPMMSVGCTGVISVASNIVPERMIDLYKAFLVEKDIQKAMDIHTGLMPLMQAMFIETNPIPVKEALALMGIMKNELRLPLCPLAEKNRSTLREILMGYGLIKD
ncbi:MAG TPA: 4-hydroxy-tetrahydrodipicolinate synthase [Syntrophorhabdaceae bacterium]|nr:4-hydroxy-tetrahydrodipicolinate synthase [Syntrophorhabdaceae bacterium]HOT42714.1 4-hydroxy-tetrahydrodipicolinate synthase [Syntrophorhabdaceae bacterium]HPC66829.1 4-hydroxy-tetrahydrodipicolinate synthase [Syntrophorhabdaceae bacterium]HQE79355.1 4-hydroxy-tetrahydrodipicolinate synthase [Syntrophorhabdaceae bacterium]HQH43008.1 4-hydroxy-tetrahydrodipicolinate synthase [Syntrophorhabdaceae bacterium]